MIGISCMLPEEPREATIGEGRAGGGCNLSSMVEPLNCHPTPCAILVGGLELFTSFIVSISARIRLRFLLRRMKMMRNARKPTKTSTLSVEASAILPCESPFP